MLIRFGYDLTFGCLQPTPMVVMLLTHPSLAPSLLRPDAIHTGPAMAIEDHVDMFGNRCGRLTAPSGPLRMWCDAVAADSGLPEPVDRSAAQHAVADLPADTLAYLSGSRYCETEELSEQAWKLFGDGPTGWGRVQAVCDWVNANVTFGYGHARHNKTAHDVFVERTGVCRDFAHLAITLCRCLNIPARYASGYLGDIGVPADPNPMDFSAWFEVYLGKRWYTFDARHNKPRIGRILLARGRDAADVAMTTSFGAHRLTSFKVWTHEIQSLDDFDGLTRDHVDPLACHNELSCQGLVSGLHRQAALPAATR